MSVNTQDNYYWYDGLQQVTRHDRGNLASSFGSPYTGIENTLSVPCQQQELFNFDDTGNWNSDYSLSPALDQARVNNQANQIVSLEGPASVVKPRTTVARSAGSRELPWLRRSMLRFGKMGAD